MLPRVHFAGKDPGLDDMPRHAARGSYDSNPSSQTPDPDLDPSATAPHRKETAAVPPRSSAGGAFTLGPCSPVEFLWTTLPFCLRDAASEAHSN